MKYKKLELPIQLPKELEHDIDNYVDYINSDIARLSEDCYQCEIISSLKWCKRESLLDDEVISQLKQYYIRGGIYGE